MGLETGTYIDSLNSSNPTAQMLLDRVMTT